MEFDEHEEEQEEVGAQAIGNSGRKSGGYRYRECLKNHALSVGGHALDGCGEFMAAGEDGTLDALKCAACSCHRNFHRKETNIQQQQQQCHQPHQQAVQHQYIHPPPYYHHHDRPPGYLNIAPSPYFHHQRPLALPSTSREDLDEISNPSSSGGGGGGGGGGSSSKKRFRTKFTQEQKDQMLAFSERLGWRIQKHDEAVVQQFCAETGVKRHVLKVWMHNNKHTIGKKP
ncbi:putative transcription factor ZF-HD family [Helianthus annuus]|nr:putative transcription factor ZF-HD family [Helianthus annuus]